jgi:hypothetical protein
MPYWMRAGKFDCSMRQHSPGSRSGLACLNHYFLAYPRCPTHDYSSILSVVHCHKHTPGSFGVFFLLTTLVFSFAEYNLSWLDTRFSSMPRDAGLCSCWLCGLSPWHIASQILEIRSHTSLLCFFTAFDKEGKEAHAPPLFALSSSSFFFLSRFDEPTCYFWKGERK